MGEFTPGPWECVPATEHHGPYIEGPHGGTIADFYFMTLPFEHSTANGGPSKPVSFFHEMAGPNCRLAAAAPELYEALKALTNIMENNGVQWWPGFDEARAALQKARPEEGR